MRFKGTARKERGHRGKRGKGEGARGRAQSVWGRMAYNALALTIIRRPWTVILSGMLVTAVVSSVAVFQVRHGIKNIKKNKDNDATSPCVL